MTRQEKLAELKNYASRRDSLVTIFYNGCYIHCGVYNGVSICQVHFNYGVEYYSKSLASAKRFVNKMIKGLL